MDGVVPSEWDGAGVRGSRRKDVDAESDGADWGTGTRGSGRGRLLGECPGLDDGEENSEVWMVRAF
jgi:hypothetical protein